MFTEQLKNNNQYKRLVGAALTCLASFSIAGCKAPQMPVQQLDSPQVKQQLVQNKQDRIEQAQEAVKRLQQEKESLKRQSQFSTGINIIDKFKNKVIDVRSPFTQKALVKKQQEIPKLQSELEQIKVNSSTRNNPQQTVQKGIEKTKQVVGNVVNKIPVISNNKNPDMKAQLTRLSQAIEKIGKTPVILPIVGQKEINGKIIKFVSFNENSKVRLFTLQHAVDNNFIHGSEAQVKALWQNGNLRINSQGSVEFVAK